MNDNQSFSKITINWLKSVFGKSTTNHYKSGILWKNKFRNIDIFVMKGVRI